MNGPQGPGNRGDGRFHGIGAGCDRVLVTLGAKIAIHYNSFRSTAEQVVADIQKVGGEALALQGDLRIPAR